MKKLIGKRSFLIAIGILIVILSAVLSYYFFGGRDFLPFGNQVQEGEVIVSENVSEINDEGDAVSRIAYDDELGFDPMSVETSLGSSGEAVIEIVGNANVSMTEVLEKDGYQVLPNEEELGSNNAVIVINESGEYIFENSLKPQHHLLIFVK